MLAFTVICCVFVGIIALLAVRLSNEKYSNKLLRKDRDFWLQEFRKEGIRNHETMVWLIGEEDPPPPSMTLVRGGLEEED